MIPEYELPELTYNQLKDAIEKKWCLPAAIKPAMSGYFLLYHSAHHIVNTTWRAGTISHQGYRYHVIFTDGLSFDAIRSSDADTQYALSFRFPRAKYLAAYPNLVPVVLVGKGNRDV